jgi:predicted RNA-binding protein YlqC (UPF0109 family)
VAADLKGVLEHIAVNLVDRPEQVSVTQSDKGGAVALELRVAPEDMGKVIGRGGRVAKDIRALLSAAAGGSAKVFVDIIDD